MHIAPVSYAQNLLVAGLAIGLCSVALAHEPAATSQLRIAGTSPASPASELPGSQPGMAFASDSEPAPDVHAPAMLKVEEASLQPLKPEAVENRSNAGVASTNAPAAVGALRAPVGDLEAAKPAAEVTTPPLADGQVPIEAASFNGLRPAESTLEDVKRAFGAPYQTRDMAGVSEYLFRYPPFERVEVGLVGGRVVSIMVQLDKPYGREALARQLGLSDVQPAELTGEAGEVLGHCYPERGVLFGAASETDRVSHILLEPIDAMPFVLRAELNFSTSPSQSLSDLKRATTLNPRVVRAQWLKAELLLKAGRPHEALTAASAAVQLDPQRPECILVEAAAMAANGDHTGSLKRIDSVLQMQSPSPEVLAKAYLQRGDLHAGGPSPDYAKAYQDHQASIQHAKAHCKDTSPGVRQAALQAMVGAHLGIIKDISLGRWKQKDKAIPRWMAKAREYADELVQSELAGEDIILKVHAAGITAAAALDRSSENKLSTTAWTLTAKKMGETLIAESSDVLQAGQLHWTLGIALAGAAENSFANGEFGNALQYGEAAAEHLEQGRLHRERTDADDHLLAQICFRIGAVHSVHHVDHRLATTWFNKAAGALATPSSQSPIYWPESHRGEAFVGMAVSYWEAGEQKRALDLTEIGTRILAAAVQTKDVPESSLTVPYGNLASMYQVVGNSAKAEQYAQLSKQIHASEVQQATFVREQP